MNNIIKSLYGIYLSLIGIITEKFKVSKIASPIDDMKGFSYKDILSGKKNGKQLNSQIKQIAKNPAIFGADVSAFAEHVLKDNPSFEF